MTASSLAKRPWGVPRDIWAAYGPRFPGGYRRWKDQQDELAAGRKTAVGNKALPLLDLACYGCSNQKRAA